MNVNANVKLQLQCEGCQQIVWYFEDTNPVPVSAFILPAIAPYSYNIVSNETLFLCFVDFRMF